MKDEWKYKYYYIVHCISSGDDEERQKKSCDCDKMWCDGKVLFKSRMK